jgi:hypothetical protein
LLVGEFEPEALRRGFELGLSALEYYGLEVTPEALKTETLDMTEGLLGEFPEPLSSRFVEGFVGGVIIAAAARRHYGEAPLRPDEISNYLRVSASFFNSWTHPE